MSTTSFDAWFQGSPLELNIGATKDLSYWFQGTPVLRPDITQITANVSLQMRARIAAQASKTFQARVRILATVDRAIDMRAHIKNLATQALQMRARMARRQGWPIPPALDPSFLTFQPTQLQMRARVKQGVRAAQSIDLRASIIHSSAHLLQLRARIVIASRLSMRARIKPRRAQTLATMTYLVARASKTRALMLFYVQGNVVEQTLSMKARIVKAQTTRVTNVFVAAQALSGSSILTFGFDSTQRTLQDLRIGARIKAS